ncbi:UDP-glucosyltransferase 2-like [Sitodiplosis mosellana]|uniref:UDP-glucosyltransferase 2-like n=1 Tax=Sitodiplosis mosellana TaxID=263140 RepID=UPI002444680C|nr:UDP-glucosyltransferase 2-like [Sitodiplosis mosellana]
MVLKVLFVLIFLWGGVNTYRILVALPYIGRSHYRFGSALSQGLAAAGHEVTVISPYKELNPMPNYHQVYLEHTEKRVSALQSEYTKLNFATLSSRALFKALTALRKETSGSITNSQNFQRFLQNKTRFDVILIETIYSEELLVLGYHFNAPIISISPVFDSTEMYSFTAIPSMKSFTPNIFNSYTEQMNFWQRLHNMLTYFVVHYVSRMFMWAEWQANCELMFPNTKNIPPLQVLKGDISMILLNSHPSLTGSRLLSPNIIEVGGLAIQPDEVQPLPSDLQIFLDEANFGAIFFSLGTVVDDTQIMTEANMAFLGAMAELSNIKFLVKGNEMSKLAQNIPNVLVRSWFPQKAILKHRNLRCFITHGGLNSIQESIYYSKPIIVIPFYFDQFVNARWAHENGYGIELPFSEMTKTKLKSSIERVLHDSSYTIQAHITSERFRDRIVGPMETAIYWTEYLAETKGAPHLHSDATHFATYLFYNLDVWAFFFTIILSIGFILLFVAWKILATIISFIKLRSRRAKVKLP